MNDEKPPPYSLRNDVVISCLPSPVCYGSNAETTRRSADLHADRQPSLPSRSATTAVSCYPPTTALFNILPSQLQLTAPPPYELIENACLGYYSNENFVGLHRSLDAARPVVVRTDGFDSADTSEYESFDRHKGLACCVIFFCGFLPGIVAFLLAVLAESTATLSTPRTARRLGHASLAVSLLAIVAGLSIIGVFLGLYVTSIATAFSRGYIPGLMTQPN